MATESGRSFSPWPYVVNRPIADILSSVHQNTADWRSVMFIVERVLKRGLFRDKVLMTATENASLSRNRLGWDLLQAPDLKFENMEVVKGQRLVVSLTNNTVTEGQSISVAEVARSTAFNRLWRRAAA